MASDAEGRGSVKLAFPKPKKRNKRKTFWRNGHEYLYGRKAHLLRRVEIYKRAGGIVALWPDGGQTDCLFGMCEGCEQRHPVGWHEGEWHHNVKSYGGVAAIVCPAGYGYAGRGISGITDESLADGGSQQHETY